MISILKEIEDPRKPGLQLQTHGREALMKAKKQRQEAQQLQQAKQAQQQLVPGKSEVLPSRIR